MSDRYKILYQCDECKIGWVDYNDSLEESIKNINFSHCPICNGIRIYIFEVTKIDIG